MDPVAQVGPEGREGQFLCRMQEANAGPDPQQVEAVGHHIQSHCSIEHDHFCKHTFIPCTGEGSLPVLDGLVTGDG